MNDVFLGIIAVAVLIMAIIQVAAIVVAGPRTPTRTIVARVATRTAFRRPDSTRNVAPSYRDGAVSAPSAAGSRR